MIQVMGLRSFVSKEGEKVTYDKIFPTAEPIPSVKALFESLDSVLEQIPKSEHWNLFYTPANCGEGKREFASSKVLAFDLDGIKLKFLDNYIHEVLAVLGADRETTGIVASGNGLHFLLELQTPITEKEYYKKNRAHYKAVCEKINKAIEIAGLPGKADTSVFEPRRILRLPGTVNRKPDKPEKQCTLLNPIKAVARFSLVETSGVPIVAEAEQIDARVLKRYPRTDASAVLSGCGFIKHCQDNASQIAEPAWYAALSITARLEGEALAGFPLSHELSKGHPSYTSEETARKIDQALDASGPRTCESINNLWDGCKACPNFQKVTTPLLIRGAGTIATELTGFWNIPWGESKAKPTPNHEDLMKFFDREKKFKVIGDSRQVYVWSGTHYVPMEKASLEAFARDNFDPKPSMDITREFRQRVEISNIMPVEWWNDTTHRKMNFLNGYLDIDSMNFMPHDPTLPFRNVLPYSYDPHALAPCFTKMTKLVTGGDLPTIEVLLQFMGYSLANDTCWAQKALVLTGEGSNGKSTFLDVLKALAGKNNYASINMAKIDSDYNIATLDKRLFNISEETPPKAFIDNATFKNLTTGGTFLVRMPYKEPYEISNRAKMILTCNTLPETFDNTHGFYRRLLIVPFNQTIDRGSPDFDAKMGDKLALELPGIFNLVIQAYHRLTKAQAFADSQKIQDSLDEYRMENDTVLYWAKEFLVIHTNGTFESCETPMRDLYANYRDLMKSMSRIPVHEVKFFKQLAKITPQLWGEHPYRERVKIKDVVIDGARNQFKVIRGVQIQQVN